MTDNREATLDELLSEPIIRKVMARDGFSADDIRHLVRQAHARAIGVAHQGPRTFARDVHGFAAQPKSRSRTLRGRMDAKPMPMASNTPCPPPTC
jgi:hypothetical protein